MRWLIKSIVLVFVSGVIVSGCRLGDKKARYSWDITQPEAMNTAWFIDSAIKNKKPVLFNRLFDPGILAKKVADFDNSAPAPEFEKSIEKALSRGELADNLIMQTQNGGSYQFVKRYQDHKKQHLIFRIYSDDGGLNYHDFELVKKNDSIRIADVYIYSTGQTFSSLLGSFTGSMGTYDNDVTKKERNETYATIGKINIAVRDGKYRLADKYYLQLPAEVRKTKLVQIQGLTIASQLEDSLYLKRLKTFESSFPDDPATSLLGMTGNIMNGDYGSAMKSLEKLDHLLGKDYFLDYYRAWFLKEMGQNQEAENHLSSLYENFPLFEDGILLRIDNYNKMNDEKQAKKWLDLYRSTSSFDQNKLVEWGFE